MVQIFRLTTWVKNGINYSSLNWWVTAGFRTNHQQYHQATRFWKIPGAGPCSPAAATPMSRIRNDDFFGAALAAEKKNFLCVPLVGLWAVRFYEILIGSTAGSSILFIKTIPN